MQVSNANVKNADVIILFAAKAPAALSSGNYSNYNQCQSHAMSAQELCQVYINTTTTYAIVRLMLIILAGFPAPV